MSKLASVLKKHYGVLILAALVSALMYLPQYWFVRDLGPAYQGVYFSATDSEDYYAARIAEVYDGHLALANPYHAEYKNLPYVQPPLPEMLYAGLGRIFGWGRVAAGFLGSRLVFPFLLTVLVYAFAYALSRSRLLSLFISALLLLGLNLLMDPREIFRVFRFETDLPGGLAYARPVSPQIHSLFFFSYLLVFWKWLESRRRVFLVVSAIILGLSFYTYFFLWSFLLAASGLLFLYFLVKKDLAGVKALLLHGLIAIVIAVPYLINLFQFSRLAFAPQIAHLQGLVASRAPIFSLSLFCGFVAFLVLSKNLEKPQRTWLALLLFTGFIVLNQQVVTGRELHAAHYHWYFNLPLIGITLVWAGASFFKLTSKPKVLAPLAIVGLAFLFFNAYVAQRVFYLQNRDYFAAQQKYAPLYAWLNDHTPKDSVVLSFSQVLSDALPAYTRDNSLTSLRSGLAATPPDRWQYNFFLPLYLQGLSPKDALEYFRRNPALAANVIGGVANRLSYGCRACYPDSENQKLEQSYQSFYDLGTDSLLNLYRLDYIVDDQAADQWPKNFFDHFQKIGQVGEFAIYRKP